MKCLSRFLYDIIKNGRIVWSPLLKILWWKIMRHYHVTWHRYLMMTHVTTLFGTRAWNVFRPILFGVPISFVTPSKPALELPMMAEAVPTNRCDAWLLHGWITAGHTNSWPWPLTNRSFWAKLRQTYNKAFILSIGYVKYLLHSTFNSKKSCTIFIENDKIGCNFTIL